MNKMTDKKKKQPKQKEAFTMEDFFKALKKVSKKKKPSPAQGKKKTSE